MTILSLCKDVYLLCGQIGRFSKIQTRKPKHAAPVRLISPTRVRPLRPPPSEISFWIRITGLGSSIFNFSGFHPQWFEYAGMLPGSLQTLPMGCGARSREFSKQSTFLLSVGWAVNVGKTHWIPFSWTCIILRAVVCIECTFTFPTHFTGSHRQNQLHHP